MKLSTSAVLAAAAFAVASAYGASPRSKDTDPGFNALDINHDGRLK